MPGNRTGQRSPGGRRQRPVSTWRGRPPGTAVAARRASVGPVATRGEGSRGAPRPPATRLRVGGLADDAAAADPRAALAGGRDQHPAWLRRSHANAANPTIRRRCHRGHRLGDPVLRCDPAHQQAADRRRAREDRRVDAHRPAAQLVGDRELDGRVRRRRHRDRAEADEEHQDEREVERARAARGRSRAMPTSDRAGRDQADPGPRGEGDVQGGDQRTDARRGHQEAVAGRVRVEHLLASAAGSPPGSSCRTSRRARPRGSLSSTMRRPPDVAETLAQVRDDLAETEPGPGDRRRGAQLALAHREQGDEHREEADRIDQERRPTRRRRRS